MRGRAALLGVVLCVAAGVRLAHLRWMAEQPVSSYQFAWSEGDMAAHWEWAGRIAAGDLLGRDPYRPYTEWMRRIAPQETWVRWHGPGVFNKAPLYPYLLAGMRALLPERYAAIGLAHLAIGVLNAALVFALAARLFDLSTACVAGLGAALYGPSLLYESLLLRDPLAVTVSLLLVLALLRSADGAPRPWFVAGLAFALALLGRELVAPFAVLVGLWMWQRYRAERARLWRAGAAFAAGIAVGIAPLVARNLAVGAPPLALSALGVESIVYGHAADSAPAGFVVPSATADILHAAEGRLWPTVIGTLATYEGDWLRLLRNQALRAAAIVAARESADNVNWYLLAGRSPFLGLLPRWEHVLALGLVGVVLSRRRVRADDRIVLYYLALALAGLQLLPVIGRYRLVPAALLWVYGAVTLVVAARALGSRDWRRAGWPVAASAALVAASTSVLLPAGVFERCRPTDFILEAHAARARHDPDGVFGALRACLECAAEHAEGSSLPPELQDFARNYAALGRRHGRATEVAAVLERLARAYPGDPTITALLAPPPAE